jgi:septal ring factor EnvC (AmiA/AmiB activator)
MAQDFAAAFAVGEDDKHICTVDAQGVAFAAIQGLYRLLQEKDAQTAGLQAQLQRQQTENQQLTARVENLERLLQKLAAK